MQGLLLYEQTFQDAHHGPVRVYVLAFHSKLLPQGIICIVKNMVMIHFQGARMIPARRRRAGDTMSTVFKNLQNILFFH